jgi:putative membrane protein
MFRVLFYFVANIIAILGLSNLLPNFEVSNLTAAFMFIIFLTLLNFTVIPIIKFLTFPINFLTLGLFNALINIVTVGLVANSVKGVELFGTFTEKTLTLLLIVITLSVVQSLVGKLNHQ